MCIRDSQESLQVGGAAWRTYKNTPLLGFAHGASGIAYALACLLYTSDAADERSSVDLGGRRIIKKKNSRIAASLRNIVSKTRRRTTSKQTMKE